MRRDDLLVPRVEQVVDVERPHERAEGCAAAHGMEGAVLLVADAGGGHGWEGEGEAEGASEVQTRLREGWSRIDNRASRASRGATLFIVRVWSGRVRSRRRRESRG